MLSHGMKNLKKVIESVNNSLTEEQYKQKQQLQNKNLSFNKQPSPTSNHRNYNSFDSVGNYLQNSHSHSTLAKKKAEEIEKSRKKAGSSFTVYTKEQRDGHSGDRTNSSSTSKPRVVTPQKSNVSTHLDDSGSKGMESAYSSTKSSHGKGSGSKRAKSTHPQGPSISTSLNIQLFKPVLGGTSSTKNATQFHGMYPSDSAKKLVNNFLENENIQQYLSIPATSLQQSSLQVGSLKQAISNSQSRTGQPKRKSTGSSMKSYAQYTASPYGVKIQTIGTNNRSTPSGYPKNAQYYATISHGSKSPSKIYAEGESYYQSQGYSTTEPTDHKYATHLISSVNTSINDARELEQKLLRKSQNAAPMVTGAEISDSPIKKNLSLTNIKPPLNMRSLSPHQKKKSKTISNKAQSQNTSAIITSLYINKNEDKLIKGKGDVRMKSSSLASTGSAEKKKLKGGKYSNFYTTGVADLLDDSQHASNMDDTRKHDTINMSDKFAGSSTYEDLVKELRVLENNPGIVQLPKGAIRGYQKRRDDRDESNPSSLDRMSGDEFLGDRSISNEALELELKLTNKLREACKVEPLSVMTSNKLMAYKDVFDEIIDKDTTYGCVLLKIKKAYDEYLKLLLNERKDTGRLPSSTGGGHKESVMSLGSPSNNVALAAYESLVEEHKFVKRELNQEKEDRKMAERKAENILKELQQSEKMIEQQNSAIKEMRKYYSLAKTEITELKKREKAGHTQEIKLNELYGANMDLVEINKKLKDEIKQVNNREKMLLEIINKHQIKSSSSNYQHPKRIHTDDEEKKSDRISLSKPPHGSNKIELKGRKKSIPKLDFTKLRTESSSVEASANYQKSSGDGGSSMVQIESAKGEAADIIEEDSLYSGKRETMKKIGNSGIKKMSSYLEEKYDSLSSMEAGMGKGNKDPLGTVVYHANGKQSKPASVVYLKSKSDAKTADVSSHGGKVVHGDAILISDERMSDGSSSYTLHEEDNHIYHEKENHPSSLSEEEVKERPSQVSKPKVPMLNFGKLNKEATEAASQAKKLPLPMPKIGLNFENIKTGVTEYHDEFMANINEFSQSWRDAIAMEKKF